MTAYDLGDLAHVSVAFTTSAGVATDPGTVSFLYKMADDVTWTTLVYGVDITLVKNSVGNYHVDVACDAVGMAFYRWAGATAGISAAQGQFLVYSSSAMAVMLGQARANLRVTQTEEDDRIVTLILAAQREFEDFTERALLSQTVVLYLDEFPEEPIRLKPPLTTTSPVTTLKYYDENNAQQTLAAAYYKVNPDPERPELSLAYGYSWPTVYDRPGAIEITYVAGWANATTVPENVKNGILLYVSHHFRAREPVLVGQISSQINPIHDCWWNHRRVPV